MAHWFMTRASRGIGLAVAQAAVEAGEQVTATGRDPEAIRRAIGFDGDHLACVAVDVRDREQVTEAVAQAEATMGPIDSVPDCRQALVPARRTSRPMPEAWVYLLRCRDGSLYTGWTVDLERRLARHRSGVASHYTASRLPVELALAIPMPDRTAARCEEARIKRLPRPAKLALLSAAGTP